MVFTFGWEGDGAPIAPGSSRVEITLAPDGDGTLLDNSMIVYGSSLADGHAHAEANLPLLLAGGESGESPLVPGSADDSLILEIVTGEIEEMEMPPPENREKFPALSKVQIAKLRAWIEAGAVWPAGVKVEPPAY